MVCADEKTAIQALERVGPDLPMRPPGQILKRQFEYIRHGTCCLTAAQFVHTGQMLGLITPNRPSEVFTQFPDLLCTKVEPGLAIHLIVDNLSTHKGELLTRWMEAQAMSSQVVY